MGGVILNIRIQYVVESRLLSVFFYNTLNFLRKRSRQRRTSLVNNEIDLFLKC
jgi:hypothetical protein